ncbi:MAG: response regulator [Motiliproteus sp.]
MSNPAPWRILVVDDEEGVHGITRMIFRGYRFEERPIELISALSGAEARSLLDQQPDICLALLDVVMESDDEGLQLVDYIRNQLDNQDMRIILRTGHPGLAPETDVIIKYDLNDYLSKSELSASRLLSSVIVGLRSYRDICQARYQQRPVAAAKQPADDLISPVVRPLIEQNSIQLARLQQLELSPMARDLWQELHCNQLRIQSLYQQQQPTAQTVAAQPVSPRQLLETLVSGLLPLARQQRRLVDFRCGSTLPNSLVIPEKPCLQLWLTLLDHCLSAEQGPDLRLSLNYVASQQLLELTIEGDRPPQSSPPHQARQALWQEVGRSYCDSLAQQLGGSITILVDTPDKVLIRCAINASEQAS